MDRIIKKILPFFPDNKWLRKFWWHRLILVIIIPASIVGFLLFLLLTPGSIPTHIRERQIEKKLAQIGMREVSRDDVISVFEMHPAILDSYSKSKFITDNEMDAWDLGKILKAMHPVLKDYDDYQVGRRYQCNYDIKGFYVHWGYAYCDQMTQNFLLGLAYLFGTLFGTSAVYRILLYIVTNDEWKKQKRGENN